MGGSVRAQGVRACSIRACSDNKHVGARHGLAREDSEGVAAELALLRNVYFFSRKDVVNSPQRGNCISALGSAPRSGA